MGLVLVQHGQRSTDVSQQGVFSRREFAYSVALKMPGWVLVLDPPSGDPLRRVGGLSLALRLALDAQAGGADAIVIGTGAEMARAALDDPRLTIPILDAAPASALVVRAPATLLVHRAQFKQLAEHGAMPRDLGAEPFHVDAAWSFSAVDVKDERVARVAESALFRSLRKREDGWTSRFLNRYISLALSRLLVKTSLTPNQVSIAILAVGIAGAVLAAQGSYLSLLAGAFLFQMQSVLDGCDGEMSRITHRGSVKGEWLDTIGDDVTNYGFFGGAAWGLHVQTGSKIHLAAGAVVLVCGLLASAIEYRYLIRIGSGDLLKYPLSASQNDKRAESTFDKIRPLFKRDTFVLLTLVSALVGLVGPMLILFALAAVGVLASVIGAELRMARERRARAEAE